MIQHLRACLWLLVVTVLLCCVVYPLILLGIGKAVFPKQAEGSLLVRNGKVVGSRLIAQPFTKDEYFQPRPSATTPSYNAAASGASNLAGNNYLLRDRVAQQLGPIVKYASDGKTDGIDHKKGDLAGGDVEKWFQKDMIGGEKGIVAKWAKMHGNSAQAWVKSDMTGPKYGLCGTCVQEWQKSHKTEVDAWIKDNPGTPDPKPEDLAVPFFVSFSKEHPGMFPSPVAHKTTDGKSENVIEPVNQASDIQTDIQKIFFDLWLQEHADADLEKVPADMVTTSGSGLDPDITLDNAIWQLNNRVAEARATKKLMPSDEQFSKLSKQQQDEIKEKVRALTKQWRSDIEALLRAKSFSPLGGMIGVKLVNVLEINLALDEKFAVR